LTTYPCLNYRDFYADTLCHAVTLTFDPLTLKVRGTSKKRQVISLYGIWVKSSNFRMNYLRFFLHTLRYVTLWPWISTAFRMSCV